MSDTRTDKLSEIMDVKEPITYDEQVKRIVAKGFIIENPDSFSFNYLESAYHLSFSKSHQEVPANLMTHPKIKHPCMYEQYCLLPKHV